MSTAKTILGIVPGLQAASLVAMNVPSFDLKQSRKKGAKKIVKRGVKTLVGVGLIGATAGIINKMS